MANVSLDSASQPTWLIEGAIARTGRSSWLQVFRTSVGFVYSSRSGDDGLSWTPAKPMHVRNPNSKVRPPSCSSHGSQTCWKQTTSYQHLALPVDDTLHMPNLTGRGLQAQHLDDGVGPCRWIF